MAATFWAQKIKRGRGVGRDIGISGGISAGVSGYREGCLHIERDTGREEYREGEMTINQEIYRNTVRDIGISGGMSGYRKGCRDIGMNIGISRGVSGCSNALMSPTHDPHYVYVIPLYITNIVFAIRYLVMCSMSLNVDHLEKKHSPQEDS